MDRSRQLYEAGQLNEALSLLQSATDDFATREDWAALAPTLTNLGRVQLAAGRAEDALESWEKATEIYRDRLQNSNGSLQSSIYQSQALQSLGLLPRACSLLTRALEIDARLCLERAIDKKTISMLQQVRESQNLISLEGWLAFGNILRDLGKLSDSQAVLEVLASNAATGANPERALQASISLGLGNTFKVLGDRERDRQSPQAFDFVPWRCTSTEIPASAVRYYQQASEQYALAERSADTRIEITARLNELAVATASSRLPSLIAPNPDALPAGQARVYGRIQAAKNQACLAQLLAPEREPDWDALTDALMTARSEAQSLGDRRAESYSLGNLGGLFEFRAWWHQQRGRTGQIQGWRQQAFNLTEQALLLAQPSQAPDIAYRWQWQLARLLAASGDRRGAIAAYQGAIDTLESVRRDLVGINSDVRFSFLDRIEPLYRESIDLLIPPATEVASLPQAELQEILASSLYYIESLQLAELENFLQCSLLGQETQRLVTGVRTQNLQDLAEAILQADPNAALVYPILLQDGLAVIYKLPGQPLGYHRTTLDPETQDIEFVLDRLQRSFLDPSRAGRTKELAGQLYDWIILPIEQELEALKPREQSQIKTLAFVLDGALRNIPMSVLYDSRREAYLLERYAIATASSLQLLEAQRPTTFKRALIAGVSEGRDVEGRSFTPLPNVAEEVATISAALPADVLQDREFIRTRLADRIATTPYDIVHIATHGKFSSDPDETFLLLYDSLLKASEFDKLLQLEPERAIELLVLSACETAQGDKRAALGLAGIALRAGAYSTLATLWQVDDESTSALMEQFYQELVENPTLSKAEALRRAQLYIWENASDNWQIPFFWAPYTIVGNWY